MIILTTANCSCHFLKHNSPVHDTLTYLKRVHFQYLKAQSQSDTYTDQLCPARHIYRLGTVINTPFTHGLVTANQTHAQTSYCQSETYTDQLQPIRHVHRLVTANQTRAQTSYNQSDMCIDQLQSIRHTHRLVFAGQMHTQTCNR